MGLDVVLYDDQNRPLKVLKIKEELHKAIFSSNERWRSYLNLRKLNDYYLTNEKYIGNAHRGLLGDLLEHMNHILPEYRHSLQLLIDDISEESVKKVRINGDYILN